MKGTITIKPQVVFTLALNATRSMYGVVGIASRYTGYDTTQRDPRRGLEVKISTADNVTRVTVDVHIIVEYGVRIPSVVESLRHQIEYTIQRGAGYVVDEVKVHVAAVRTSAGS